MAYAVRKKGDYPKITKRNRKWLTFVHERKMNEIWKIVKKSNATHQRIKVIYVNTYDWTDEDDARRLRRELRELGSLKSISYKIDQDTREGRYSKEGFLEISKDYI
ncbi:MAG: hypothetical protein ACTSP3_01980 [Candidatus Heimdallarchaeaceae archaeon]